MNDTVASVFDASEWEKIFMPAALALGSDKQNLKFLKKLVAVAISNILYLRAELPDAAFSARKLGSMEVRVLQKIKAEQNENAVTNDIIEMVKDGMTALDKGYLRKMSLVIFDGDEDAEEGDMRKAYETYSFYFGKQDKNFTLSGNSKQQGDLPMGDQENNMPNDLTEEKIVKSTKKLLRGLIAATQELELLPEVANLTICVEYYDNITPREYEPKGYKRTNYTPQVIMNIGQDSNNENVPYFMGMGQVDMLHQKMAIRLRSKGGVLSEEDELHPVSLEKMQSQEAAEELENTTNAVNAISLDSANEGMEIETAQMQKKEQRKMSMKQKRKQLEEELLQQDELDRKKYQKYSTDSKGPMKV